MMANFCIRCGHDGSNPLRCDDCRVCLLCTETPCVCEAGGGDEAGGGG